MKMKTLFFLMTWLPLAAVAAAAEHRVEVLKEGPPAAVLSKEISAELSPGGLKVIRGESRAVCEIWLCKQWKAKPVFKPNSEVLYPFEIGQLIGVVRYQNKGGDFRDQTIAKGVYTLRYAQQPVDGNHEGTSPTRDFLVLVQAKKDTSAKPIPEKQLMKLSAEAAGTMHPALLALQKVQGPAKPPSIRHSAQHDWWIVRFAGKAKAGQLRDLTAELVVAGHAPE